MQEPDQATSLILTLKKAKKQKHLQLELSSAGQLLSAESSVCWLAEVQLVTSGHSPENKLLAYCTHFLYTHNDRSRSIHLHRMRAALLIKNQARFSFKYIEK